MFEEARERLKHCDAGRRKLVRRINVRTQVSVDELLRSAQDRGALSGCDLALAEGITKFVEVQDVVTISTGWHQEVDVEVMDDKSSLGQFDLDQVDVPPTLYRALEHNRPGQLDALVEQEEAAIDGRPSGHLIRGQEPSVVGDNLCDPAAGAPLTRSVQDPDTLDERRCCHLVNLS
ncbi:hypothetical protein [Nonomuraea sp. NEAU-A123]|uniref:hypothetical protein n=1 Tax=Nonomuraea sp. NEAU-A123 TaxID=2839649 RepID=UPI002032B672|nr:hypothetical protein [Nonomuraea sp. NEAU-A123]